MRFDPVNFHRRSVRLEEYDYSSPGAYFVTVVTFQRANLFGDVENGEIKLNQYEEVALREWFRTEKLRENVHLEKDEMVIMPNHIHGIVWIDEIETSRGTASLRPYRNIPNVTPNSLGAIIRGFKSAVTYHINVMRGTRAFSVWQRNYYEHIVRDQNELESIANYILSNPATWLDDPEYRQNSTQD